MSRWQVMFLPALFGLAALLLGCRAQDGSSCSFVMRQGIYNSYRSTSSATYLNAAQSAICGSDEAYTEDEYLQDLKKAQSGNEASTSRQFKDAQVGARYGPFAGKLRFTSDNTQSNEKSYMAAESFAEYQRSASAMRKSSCASSSSEIEARQAATVLQDTIDPNIVAAYVACLDLFKAGVQIKTSAAPDAQNIALDVKFVGQTSTSRARITGLQVIPPESAACTITSVTGTALPRPFSAPITLAPNQGVTVVCNVVPGKVPPSKRSDVLIITDVGGTWRGMLFHTPDITEVAKLTEAVNKLQKDLLAVKTKADTDARTLNSTIKREVQAAKASLQAENTVLRNGLNEVKLQSNTTTAKLAGIGIEGRRLYADSICLGPSATHVGSMCLETAGAEKMSNYHGLVFRSLDKTKRYLDLYTDPWDHISIWSTTYPGAHAYFNKNGNLGVCYPTGDISAPERCKAAMSP